MRTKKDKCPINRQRTRAGSHKKIGALLPRVRLRSLGCGGHPTLGAPDEVDHPERGGNRAHEVDRGVDVPADHGWVECREARPESADPEHVSLGGFRRAPQFVRRSGVRHNSEELNEAIRDERVALPSDEPTHHDDRATAKTEALHRVEGELAERSVERSPYEHGDEDGCSVDRRCQQSNVSGQGVMR